jgi:hypothetical protein
MRAELGEQYDLLKHQRDDLMLVVACPPSEAALLLKLLLDEEKAKARDLFYLAADDFARLRR